MITAHVIDDAHTSGVGELPHHRVPGVFPAPRQARLMPTGRLDAGRLAGAGAGGAYCAVFAA